jgi:ATP-binding cassette subfamily F protein 3
MLIRADSISRSFGAKEVLKSVTLQINEGDRVGLVGRNGAGKTTLLKILQGEIKPDTGELTIRAKKVCYLSQFHQEGGSDLVEDMLKSASPHTKNEERLAELEEMMVTGPESGGMDWDTLMTEYNSLQEEMAKSSSKDSGSRKKDILESVGLTDRPSGKMSGSARRPVSPRY